MTTVVRDQAYKFWRARIDSGDQGSSFPADRPQVSKRGQCGASKSIPLERGAWSRFVLACENEGISAHAAFAGLVQILLHRYTVAETIEVGVHCGSVRLVRTNIEPCSSILQNLKDVAIALHQANSFACSCEELQEWSKDATTPPLSVMVVIPESTDPEQWAEVSGSYWHCGFALSLTRSTESVWLNADYDTSAYLEQTVENILRQLEFLLESFHELLSHAVKQVPLCTAAESQRMAQAAEDNVQQFISQQLIHQRFEERVRSTPEAVALVLPGEQRQEITYAELNARANRLAHYLQSKGAGPDVLVGLFLDRTPDLIIAMLAIVKAGAAYLPIDLSYPSDRVAFMLADAECPIVITDSKTVAKLPHTSASAICIDTDSGKWATLSSENPTSTVGLENLAYCIFTSGSTGKPKGVLITHRNVARLFDATNAWFNFSRLDTWTFFHSSAFDFSVWEIWGALTYGGRLVVVPFLNSRSPERFFDLLLTERVTVLNQTPSAFRQLVGVDENRPHHKLDHLRFVIFGGEALNLQSLAVWFDKYGDDQLRLVNMYGITETTVHVTYRPLKRSDLAECPGSVIGAPIPDLSVHILDAGQKPVPTGIPGEIYVGGAGLARGYLKRESLTAERFVDNPFCFGKKLYRSGDLARRLPGGDLEYMGRADQQVKIRGFRIELGEVQAALTRQPNVREAFVTARECDGDKALVAYVVPASDEVPAVDTLRRALQTMLPGYMVPAHFVFLPQFPLTRNGKVDRTVLPAPSAVRSQMEQSFSAPRTDLERRISKAYRQVLNIATVGADDDFFDLGGNSLTLAQLHTLVQKLIGRNFSVAELFIHTTVRKLATSLEQTHSQNPPQQAVLDRAHRQRQSISVGNWRR